MLLDSLFIVPFENLTYFEVAGPISFFSLNLHLVTKPARIIEALPQKFRSDHLQDEVLFRNLYHWPGRLTGFPVSILYNRIQ